MPQFSYTFATIDDSLPAVIHNYDPVGGGVLPIEGVIVIDRPDDTVLGGLVVAPEGAQVLLWNAGAGTVTIPSGDKDSDEANRFAAPQGVQTVIAPGEFAIFVRLRNLWRGPI